jgi:hypothetical protein
LAVFNTVTLGENGTETPSGEATKSTGSERNSFILSRFALPFAPKSYRACHDLQNESDYAVLDYRFPNHSTASWKPA